jgi:hypothetical protein
MQIIFTKAHPPHLGCGVVTPLPNSIPWGPRMYFPLYLFIHSFIHLSVVFIVTATVIDRGGGLSFYGLRSAICTRLPSLFSPTPFSTRRPPHVRVRTCVVCFLVGLGRGWVAPANGIGVDQHQSIFLSSPAPLSTLFFCLSARATHGPVLDYTACPPPPPSPSFPMMGSCRPSFCGTRVRPNPIWVREIGAW